MNSFTEENYLKAIYVLSGSGDKKGVHTTAIAKRLNTKAASVTDMIKKLAAKGLVHYRKYQGVTLTREGSMAALRIIRKHRLWESFLVEKLSFRWDEVHEIAEQLEHIHSPELINRLEDFLGHPQHDPHGDPIPDRNGKVADHREVFLSDLTEGEGGLIVGVKDTSSEFLQYLEGTGLILGKQVKVKKAFGFDKSKAILVNNRKQMTVSLQVAKNLYVKKIAG